MLARKRIGIEGLISPLQDASELGEVFGDFFAGLTLRVETVKLDTRVLQQEPNELGSRISGRSDDRDR
jgi:hypothetical protein